jgi:hypothetical protein
VVISEAFGVHEPIADIARRFADAGFYAIAPDLMARQGDPMDCSDGAELVSDVLLKIPDAQVLSDLDTTVAWAAGNGAAAKPHVRHRVLLGRTVDVAAGRASADARRGGVVRDPRQRVERDLRRRRSALPMASDRSRRRAPLSRGWT